MKKIALITGGARGIGQAISSVLLKDTAMMILIDKAEKELTQTVGELKKLNQNVKGVHLDLNDNKYLEKVINEILVEYKYVNILINNAGIGSGVNPKMIHEYDDDFWEISLQINLTIPYKLSKCFLPGMIKKKWGRIINIASVAGNETYFDFGIKKSFGALSIIIPIYQSWEIDHSLVNNIDWIKDRIRFSLNSSNLAIQF